MLQCNPSTNATMLVAWVPSVNKQSKHYNPSTSIVATTMLQQALYAVAWAATMLVAWAARVNNQRPSLHMHTQSRPVSGLSPPPPSLRSLHVHTRVTSTP